MRTMIAAAALCGVSALATPALSQSVQGGWTVDCKSDACTAALGLMNPDTERLAATFLVTFPGAGEPPLFGVALPLGVALNPGIRLVIDGASTLSIPFEVCFPDGCRALRPMDEAEELALASGSRADIRFFPYGSDKPVSMAMPLFGFADAVIEARDRLGE